MTGRCCRMSARYRRRPASAAHRSSVLFPLMPSADSRRRRVFQRQRIKESSMDLVLGFILAALAAGIAYLAKPWRPLFTALWLCVFCVVFDVVAIGLVVSDQGQDFLMALDTAGSEGAAHRFWF